MALTSETLREFLASELSIDTSDINGETPLFSSGLIDSFSLVTLMTFVEKECKFRINPVDVNLNNFDSIDKIVAYTQRATAG